MGTLIGWSIGRAHVAGRRVTTRRVRLMSAALRQVTVWWLQLHEPVPMRLFTQRWARLVTGVDAWPDWYSFLAEFEAVGAVVVVWRASGARVLFTREAWASLSDAERFRWEYGRGARVDSGAVEFTPEAEAFAERWRAHTEGMDNVVPFFRSVTKP